MTPLGDVMTLIVTSFVKAWLSTLPPEVESAIGDSLGLD